MSVYGVGKVNVVSTYEVVSDVPAIEVAVAKADPVGIPPAAVGVVVANNDAVKLSVGDAAFLSFTLIEDMAGVVVT